MNAPESGLAPHRGTLILVLGIIGIVACFPCGIAAWIMGKGDLQKMAAGTMDPEGQGNTNIGKILGIIGTILGIIGLVIVAITIAGSAAAVGAAAIEASEAASEAASGAASGAV